MSALVSDSDEDNAVVESLSNLEEDDFAALEQILMTEGTEKEWAAALKMNEFELIDSLVGKLDGGSSAGAASSSSSSAAAEKDDVITILKCLALSCNIVPSIWQLYSDFHGIEKVINITDTVVNLITCAVSMKLASSPKKIRPNSVPYAGFDVRDIADYNVRYNEEDAALDEGEQLKQEELQQLDNCLEVYLLVLCQLYSSPLQSLSQRLQTESAQLPEEEIENDTAAASGSNTTMVETTTHNVIGIQKTCLVWCKHVLEYTNKVDEDYFLQALKFVSHINFHFDTSKVSLKNQSSPLSRHLYDMQTMQTLSNNSIGEGLLHHLNDVGYPNHKTPELSVYIKLIIDLCSVQQEQDDTVHNGTNSGTSACCYFYLNDLKILIDICIREITNIQDSDYMIKHKYLTLLGAIISTNEFKGCAYRSDDLRESLKPIEEECPKVMLRQKASQIISALTSEL